MPYEHLFLQALGLTMACEVLVALVLRLHPAAGLKNYSLVRLLLLVAGASLLTLPYLWFLLPAFLQDRTLYVLLGELAVFLVETVYYRLTLQLSWGRAALLAFVTNLFSWGAGEIWNRYF